MSTDSIQILNGISDYPKDYKDNLAFRVKLIHRAKQDKTFRAKVKKLFHEDILFAFNAFFWTFDVRRKPDHHQPFCTYPFQDKAILTLAEQISNGEDLLVEKSRDMGVSWMVILTYLWFWLNPDGGADFLLGSRIEDYVDKKGDMRTLLQKARYALYRLPFWLLPKGFKTKTHDNFMKLINPETGASITGESNNANFSTGGRYLSALFDEFAKWEGTDKSAWTAAGDATPSRIAVSTPFGAGGQYYDLVTDGKTKKLRLHWSLHPRKNPGLYCVFPRSARTKKIEIRSPWYDRECARRGPLEIAQELDIDYLGAGNPVFDGVAAERIIELLNLPKPPLEYYSPELPTMTLTSASEPRELEGYFVVYEEVDKKTTLAMGVDVVEGKEDGDFAVIKVISRETKTLVSSYFSRIDEVNLAKVIKAISSFYAERAHEAPWVGVEANGPGLATFDFCDLFDVENLFMMPNYDSAKESVTFAKGWRTTSSSRKVLVAGIKEWLIEARGWTNSRCLREMTTFVKDKTGKPIAQSGRNDDEVMAFGIALQVDVIAPYEEVKDEEVLTPESFLVLRPTDEKIPSIEERCLNQAMENIRLRDNQQELADIYFHEAF